MGGSQGRQGSITAYSSSVDETDATPLITASGQRVFLYLVANNCLKFGTVVRIMDKTYLVHDRMKKRYGCKHFDIWQPSKREAKAFGLQRITVEIVKRVRSK